MFLGNYSRGNPYSRSHMFMFIIVSVLYSCPLKYIVHRSELECIEANMLDTICSYNILKYCA
jgi:hypothetical protein